ncbi:PQQ-dependent sugar dehydrogenase [Parendozoicomonas haliclonae]|uniref:PQQ-dependent sugar dehydrogenase n=1 Tax=Parendozoicomonas haliclonae TaxID=1960125 RepID=UPI001A993CCC|nr:PQQ-dependent sugar dehydrogenase [Parendozoicomonas haliclonae]
MTFKQAVFPQSLFVLLLLLLVQPLRADQPEFKVDEVANELSHPWSLAELPDGQLLVTERSGELKRISKGQVQTIEDVPEVYFAGQGGLLDIKLHPQFAQNGWIYLSYAHGTLSDNALSLMRAKLNNNALTEQQILFTAAPSKDTPVHYAGRIAFMPDNTLLLAIGDGFDYREHAQKKDSLLGKIIRLNDDGSIPSDNPYLSDTEARGELYSIGHRNPQGLVYDKQRNIVLSNEHGPAGGDEINIIQPGKNYGWPVITYGRDYSGASITPFTEYPGMEQPLVNWTPSIAPSSMVVYYGDMFPEFHGDLLNTTLKNRELRWVHMENNKPGKETSLLKHLKERLRHIEVAKDGSLYLLTDSGKVLRVHR